MYKSKLGVALLSLLLPLTNIASEVEHKFWLEPGWSVGKPSGNVSLDLRYNRNDYTIALGATGGSDCPVFCDNSGAGDLSYNAARLLVGKHFFEGTSEVLLEAGLAKVSIDEKFTNPNLPYLDTRSKDTFGVPVRVAKYFNGRYVGFALTADLMYTDVQWLYSLGVSVPFGKLRPRP